MSDYFWFASSQLQTRRLSKYNFLGFPRSDPLLDILNFLTWMTTVVWKLPSLSFFFSLPCEDEVQSRRPPSETLMSRV